MGNKPIVDYNYKFTKHETFEEITQQNILENQKSKIKIFFLCYHRF